MYNLAHIGIVVKDIEKSTEFYTKVLECKKIDAHENERLNMIYLRCGNTVIELLKYKDENQEDRRKGYIDHIALSTDDIDNAIERVKKHNVKFLFDSPREVNGMRIMFFLGPDGERIEFVESEKC